MIQSKIFFLLKIYMTKKGGKTRNPKMVSNVFSPCFLTFTPQYIGNKTHRIFILQFTKKIYEKQFLRKILLLKSKGSPFLYFRWLKNQLEIYLIVLLHFKASFAVFLLWLSVMASRTIAVINFSGTGVPNGNRIADFVSL